jgi:predicted negative regulator of RcsB-dependent stress response
MMKLCKIVSGLLAVACFLLSGETGYTRIFQNAFEIFDSTGFWERFSAHREAQTAWRQGTQWNSSQGSHVIYHNGSLYGFNARSIPKDTDLSLQAKLKVSYAGRTEMQAINDIGIFAFNSFECTALADYDRLNPDQNICSNIRFTSKISSTSDDVAFSIVQISAADLCSCRKAMDRGIGENNASSFYGTIARTELKRLYDNNEYSEVVKFFIQNYNRKIFLAPELIFTADSFAKTEQYENAEIILDAVLDKYKDILDADQFEQCGDIYFAIGDKESAISAYEYASNSLYNEKH